MRISQAALALITRVNSRGDTEYLTQWNNAWQAYSLIGGHVEASETFRNCCIREVTEELKCGPHAFTVGPYPYATLRFREFSRAAKVQTDYHWQAFNVRVDDNELQKLPNDCTWIGADRIRARFTTEGKPIAEQVHRVYQAVDKAEFDLFVSYGHADNQDESVTALIEHIRQEHEQFSPNDPLKIFFDVWRIQNGDDWQRRIYSGLIEAKAMLAVLSPAYFASEWCRREYETFVQQQLKHTYPGEPVHAIYIHPHPDFDGDIAHPQRAWFDSLKQKQFLDAKPWWPDGQQALQRDVVVGRLKELREKIWERVCDARTVQHSPTNLRDFHLNFVGREKELTQLWNTLRRNHAVAVAAVQGVGGLGKTALARAYAHVRRRDYPGGQFEIAMENITTVDALKFEIISLANNWLSAGIPDELINTNLNAAFAKARVAFERPGQGTILLLLDNVATDGLLTDRSSSLPSSEHVHVLATTRLDPQRWGITPLRLESLSTADALDLFLKYRPFQIPDDQQWHQARTNPNPSHETGAHNEEPSLASSLDGDEASVEWKAAIGIVNRLGGHALAVEVVAVYLGNNRSISLRDYLNGLIRKGTSLKLGQAGDDPKVRARLAESIETNIADLLKPTFEKLDNEYPLAMRALEWAALMPPDHVPWTWLRELVDIEYSTPLQHDPDDPDPWQDGVVPILRGLQLLTGDEEQPTSRMHRIVQAAVTMHSVLESKFSAATNRDQKLDQLLSYVTSRSDVMERNWGRPRINWELTPLFEIAQLLLPILGVKVGLLVDRLIVPLRQDGRLLPALKLQQQVIELEETRASSAPENADYARDLSVSYNKMGDLFRALGNGTQAREYYEKALEVRERLASSAPENADYARELGISYERMADLLKAEGRATEAIKLLTRELEIGERLMSNAPENADYARYTSVVYNKMGDLFRALGNGTQAREYYEKALEVSERLASSAPENADYARDLGVSYERMGDLFLALGNGTMARESYEKALKVRERLASSAPENADYARDLSVSHNKMGDLFRALGNGTQARESYEKALKIAERLASSAPENADYARDLCVSYTMMAQIEEDDQAKALVWWLRAHDILQGMVDRGLLISPEDLDFLQQLKQILDEAS